MYYPRARAEAQCSDWGEDRSRRTQSQDYSSSIPGVKTSLKDTGNFVEDALRQIRSRRPSENMTSHPKKGDNRRLSCEEIDKVLTEIRSRSQSLSSRPPPPQVSPPPLPRDSFDAGKTPFGNARSPPPSQRPTSSHRSRPRMRSNHPAKDPDTKTNDHRSSVTENDISNIINYHQNKRQNDAEKRDTVTEEDIERIIKGHKNKDRAENRSSHSKVPDEPIPDIYVEKSENNWHHNPAYDAPKASNDKPNSHLIDDYISTKSQVDKNVVDETSKAAFDTVRELNERLQSMSEDLDRVRAAADKINEDLQREMTCKNDSGSDYENDEKKVRLPNETHQTKAEVSNELPQHKARLPNESLQTKARLPNESIPVKEPKPEQHFFRKINVTLSSGNKAEEGKKIPVINVPLKNANKHTFPNEESDEPKSRKIHISKERSPLSKPDQTGSNRRSKSMHQEPTETNRVIITELSSDSESELPGSSPTTSQDESENEVYKATVRTTHICRPKKSSPVRVPPPRKKKFSLQKIGRPESIYIDPLIDGGIDGDRFSLADQKKEEGNELYKTSNYREALQRYSEAINLCPETPAFYGNRAACYMMLAQYSRALDDARASVQLDPQFTKGYIRVAKCCIATGDINSARQAIDAALAIEPNNGAVASEMNSLKVLVKHHGDAQNAFNNGDHRKALFCLDRALEVATAARSLKLLRAECLAYLGRYGEAQEVANDLLRQDSTNVDAIFVRGLCLYYEDNVDKAFTHFQQVLRFAPDHQRAKDIYKKAKLLRQKKEDGNAAFKSNKLNEAYSLYTEALAIDSCNKFTNAKLFFNRATVAAKLKKLRESIEDCSSALALDEKYMKALLRRAKSYLELEMFDEAVRDYEAALRSDRGNHEYRQLLQHAKLELKKSKRKDYYKILGVERNANEDEIKRAYRKRALIHHPDRHSSSSEEEKKEHEKKFKEIGEAYGVLSDAKKRARYDSGCDIDDLEGSSGRSGYGADIDPDQIFQAFFSGGGHGMHGGHNFGGFGAGPSAGQMPGGFSFQFG